MPSLPTILLFLVLASLYAGLFHFVKGKTTTELPLFWAASLAGFGTGQLAAYSLGTDFLMIGEIHLLEGTLASFIFLSIVRWLKL
jgi:hypothetical protein